MHDGRTVLRSTFPGLWTNVTGMSGPGPRLVEEVRHVLLSLTWDIDSVLVSFTGDINHVSSDSLDLKHLTRTDQPLVRPQLTKPQSQQNWRSEEQDELHHVDCHEMTSSWLQRVNHGTANHNEDRKLLCERRKPGESESVSQLSLLLLMIIVFPPRKNDNLSFLH